MPTSNGMNEPNKKFDQTNRTYTYIAVGVVVLALVAWGIYANSHQNGTPPYGAGQVASVPNATSTPTSTPTSAGSGKKLSYGAAIQAYPERFQFSQCQGRPSVIAVKKGTPVMLDNRNATAYTIKADTQTFVIAGYDYAVFYPQVLGNLVVNCNGKPSVTLNVEK